MRPISTSATTPGPGGQVTSMAVVDIHDEWQVSDRRHLSETSMALLDPVSDTAVVAAIQAGD